MVEGKEVISEYGAVATGPEEAARVGARVLEQGGNAMDAAAATSVACCMLEPARTGVGGYVLCGVVLEGKTGRVWSLDANSIAPAAAHEKMYEVLPMQAGVKRINENEYFCSVKDDVNVWGSLAVGPPGVMAGVGTLWERWGRLKWPAILEPSLTLLEDGFPYGSTAGHIANLEDVIRKFESTAEHLMPEGKVPSAEDIWHRRDMEKTLARVSEAGWQDFYEGEIGHQIADYILETGGVMTRQDMASYRPRITEAYGTRYRNADVYAAILPNGGLSSLQVLNMLECFKPVSDDTVEYWHRFAEVLKLVWRDRLRYLGDPDFVDVPIARLLSKDYAAGRMETARQFPEYVDRLVPPPAGDAGHGTQHVSTADAEGNVVSVTISHGGAFGSCVTVPGTGILLGHGMCRLDPRPGGRNSVASKKRPLNNTAPMVVRLPDRDVAAGLPGGRRIISVNARVVQQIVDEGVTSHHAAIAPRMHVQTDEPVMVTESLDGKIVKGLQEMGHEVEVVKGVAGQVHCAEYLKAGGKVRAGGDVWAAGVG
ncbi:MAG: gamma-glutamyltransferase [bacterium]|nr:gamma-glutamyltransferase [bacterium]